MIPNRPPPKEGRCLLNRRCQHGKQLARPGVLGPSAPGESEELLIADTRAGLTPADVLESKLLYLLRGAPVAGSHVRMGAPRVRGRAAGCRHSRRVILPG